MGVERFQEKENEFQLYSDALAFAREKHAGQFRKGEIGLDGKLLPYIVHPERAVKIIATEMKIIDPVVWAAAILHDVVEDCKVSEEEIRERFGDSVGDIVMGVTKLKDTADRKHTDFEELQRVIRGTELNVRIAVVKLADRLDNMRTLGNMPEKKQREKAKETMDAYVPLAEAMGMWDIKRKLEDLAFQYINPQAYQEMYKNVMKDTRVQLHFQKYWIMTLTEQLMLPENARIDIVTNSLYQIWKKMKRELIPLEHVNDVVSFRISVPTREEARDFDWRFGETFANIEDHQCTVDDKRSRDFYRMNSHKHHEYRVYQRTLVHDRDGAFEITFAGESDEQRNQLGVAYDISKNKNGESYRFVMAFTKDGELMFLPAGSTYLDFAHHISPHIVWHATKVWVDGEEKNILDKVEQGARVKFEIGECGYAQITAIKPGQVNTKTYQAIRELKYGALRIDDIEKGKHILEPFIAAYGVFRLEDMQTRQILDLIANLGGQTVNTILQRVGGGYVTPDEVIEAMQRAEITPESVNKTSIKMEGVDHEGIDRELAGVLETYGSVMKTYSLVEEKDGQEMFVLYRVMKRLSAEKKKLLVKRLEKKFKGSQYTVLVA